MSTMSDAPPVMPIATSNEDFDVETQASLPSFRDNPIFQHRILSREEEVDLGRALKAAIESENMPEAFRIRDTMLEHNMRLIAKVAGEYSFKGVEFEDIFQYGVIGCERAIWGWDPEGGVKFYSYAEVAIGRTIDRFLTNEGHGIRVPASNGKIQAALVGAQSIEDIDIDAIVAKTGATESTVRATIAVRVGGLESLHAPGVISRVEQGRQSDSELVPSAVLRNVTFSAVRGAMEQLDPVSRGIIELRFGFGSEPAATVAECSRRFSLPKSRVARLIENGLSEIQEFLRTHS